MLLNGIIIIIVTICIFFISFIEIAFLTIGPQKIYKYKNTKKGKILIDLLNNHKMQVITTFAAIFTLLDTIFVLLMENYLGEKNYYTAFIIIPLIVLLLFEVIPKTYTPMIAEEIALHTVYLTKIILFISYPIRIIISIFTSILLYIIPLKQRSQESHVLEVQNTLDHYYAQGKVIKYEKNIINNILAISKITVEEVMSHRKEMISISINLPIENIIEKTLKSRHTRIPIWQDNPENIIGILNIYLLFEEMHQNKYNMQNIDIKNFITPPTFIQLNTTLHDQIISFINSKQHMSIITNEYGEIEGLITLEDIMEVIFGKIYDEKEANYIKPDIIKINENNFILDLDTTLHSISQELDILLEHNLASTINGYLSYRLNKVAEENDYIQDNRYKISLIKYKNKNKINIEVLDKEISNQNT